MSYPYDRNADFFEPAYLPQLGSNPYEFYQPPQEPGEPIIPYGWRSDWNRAQPSHSARFDWISTAPTQPFGTLSTTVSNLQCPQNTVLSHPPSAFSSTTAPMSSFGMGPSCIGMSMNTIRTRDSGTGSELEHGIPKTPMTLGHRSLHKHPSSLRRNDAKIPVKDYGKPFTCQICGKTFSQAANLTAHRRVHTGEKPFSCSVCNRPFSQSSSLVTHQRTHTGERPYPCPHCDKAFTDSSTLTKHLRTHTGHKPYGCPLCMMRFTQSGNLHRHMKTHKGQH